MKKNVKGFVLTETLIISTVVITILIIIYGQFRNVTDQHNLASKFNTVEGLYAVNNIKIFIEKENYVAMKNDIINGYLDITDCSTSYYVENLYCEQLYSKLNVQRIILTTSNTRELQNYIFENNIFEDDLKEFINRSSINNNAYYRLIVSFNNNTYATLVLN